jgi:hypothetical protein
MSGATKELINWGLEFWDSIIGTVTGVLTASPDAQFPAAWNIIQNINAAFQSLGYGLLALFFVMGLLKSAVTFEEFKRPETFIRHIVQLILAMSVISHGMEIVTGMFYYGSMLVSTVVSYGDLGSATVMPENIITAIDGMGFFGSIGMFIVAFIGVLVIAVVSIAILLQVYGRFFKIYIYAAISPIAFSGFAGSETTFMGKAFLKNFAAVCLEGAVVMIACAIWKAIAQDPKLALFTSASTDATTIVFQYLVSVVFSMILLMGTIKIASAIPKAALGV